jgi:hypothetical protein
VSNGVLWAAQVFAQCPGRNLCLAGERSDRQMALRFLIQAEQVRDDALSSVVSPPLVPQKRNMKDIITDTLIPCTSLKM